MLYWYTNTGNVSVTLYVEDHQAIELKPQWGKGFKGNSAWEKGVVGKGGGIVGDYKKEKKWGSKRDCWWCLYLFST